MTLVLSWLVFAALGGLEPFICQGHTSLLVGLSNQEKKGQDATGGYDADTPDLQ